jgi:hypothetical protein
MTMGRVYILLNVKDGTAEQVATELRKRTGVLMADITESPPDIILVLQSYDQSRLARLTIDALTPVENEIEGMQILPAMNDNISSPYLSCLQSMSVN